MDEDWEFTIPLQREDLKKIDTGQYYVKEVFDLEDSIRKCKGRVNAIFDHNSVEHDSVGRN